MLRLRAFSLLLSGLGLGAIASQPAVARPLDPEICKNLTQQRDELETRGVRQLIAGGPTQGLTQRQLADVRQFLDLESQLRFRCPFDQVLAPLKEDVPDEPDPAQPAADDAAAEPAPVKAKEPPKKKPAKAAAAKPEPKAVQGAPGAKPQPPTQPQKAAPAPRAAAKARDDAYKPPADKDGGASTLDQQAQQPK